MAEDDGRLGERNGAAPADSEGYDWRRRTVGSVGVGPLTASTIATMPARTGSGSVGHASVTEPHRARCVGAVASKNCGITDAG